MGCEKKTKHFVNHTIPLQIEWKYSLKIEKKLNIFNVDQQPNDSKNIIKINIF